MRERPSRTATAVQKRPTPEGYASWLDYWTAQGMPWRTEPEIDEARQALLGAKRQIVASPESGAYPFSGVQLTRADVEWLLATHQSHGFIGPVRFDDESQRLRNGIDLRGAVLSDNVNLSNLPLARAQFGTSLSANSLVEVGKGTRVGLILYAFVLLPAMGFLIAIPTPRINFITVDVGSYLFGTLAVMYVLGIVGTLVFTRVRPLRVLFAVRLVDYVVLSVAAAVMLIMCEIALLILSLTADDHGYALGSDIVLSIALASVLLYFLYRLWRAWTLHTREYRFRLIRQSGANLTACQLQGAHLEEAILGGAILTGVNLQAAYLEGANLDLANCKGADLRDVSLSGESSLNRTLFGIGPTAAPALKLQFGVVTYALAVVGLVLGGVVGKAVGTGLADTIFGVLMGGLAGGTVGIMIGTIRSYSVHFATSIGGVDWSQCDITQINWDGVTGLGDEYHVESGDTLALYAVLKLYRTLAHRLREEGFITASDRLTYRSLIVQRKIRLRESGIVPYLGSWLLGALAGYGYKPLRTLGVYLVTVVTFAAAYYYLAPLSHVSFSLPASLYFSIASFHGRGFFPGAYTATGTLAPDAPIVGLAALEALLGLFVEISFIATFTQRFFAR